MGRGPATPRFPHVPGACGRPRILRQWLDTFEQYDYEVERITDCGGDDVFVVASEHGTGALSGAPVGARIYTVVTVKDGKIRRYREFYDEGAALEAAGLSE